MNEREKNVVSSFSIVDDDNHLVEENRKYLVRVCSHFEFDDVNDSSEMKNEE